MRKPLDAFLYWVVPRLPSKLRAIPGPALALISLLIVINIIVWAAVGIVLRFYPALTGTAVLAYTLGLRHALDADHISAIDLMTRRLIASGQRPVAVGTFFSLGHSTIVIITCIVVAATSGALRDRFNGFERVGNIIGTSVSSAVLLILCAGNAWVLWRLVRGLRAELRKQDDLLRGVDGAEGDIETGRRESRNSEPYRDDVEGNVDADAVATHDIEQIDSRRDSEAHARAHSGPNAVAAATASESPVNDARHSDENGVVADSAAHLKLEGGGFLVRIFRRLFVLIDRPWKMYPLGVLFGLGFDTSSEVALLGIASIQGAKGTSLWLIMIFPALFTAGMCMLDTTDGALMMALYTSKTFSRDTVAILYYSIVLTGITIVVAAFIGVIQVLTLVSNVMEDPSGRFWDGVGAVGDHFDIVGGSICAVFLVTGVGSVLVYKPWRRRMDRKLAAARAAREQRVAEAAAAESTIHREDSEERGRDTDDENVPITKGVAIATTHEVISSSSRV
ncbi:high affinity nickel transport protein nic1 [Ophiostoma piceae UAMH 11346]|uniref:High affinity nickel transport protein nic1 n=1 Tax=Ophiostoma piceae (strain UAMH 11346) TaxID=1262450 RepID=S3CBF7_OPHP1|nr:high affinity nickel transport protein nic1 [Ophiostoma piceae UAMH 11346]